MMDGRNSIGRKVSLLNDETGAAGGIVLPPYLSIHSRSYSSGSESTPALSPHPQTPSEPESSAAASPLTPPHFHHHPFDSFHPKHAPQPLYLARTSSFTAMDDHSVQSMYPPVPDASGVMPYPMPATTVSQSAVYRTSQSPASESSHAPNTSSSAGKPAPKKNQYPCPLAKAFNCSDFFTTSGHAARHAKKHTGKKDAFCPECNKAFTRKDNMEQHRRTHQNVRGPAKSSTDGKVKKPTKPAARKADKPLPAPLEAAALARVEEQQQQQHQQQQQQIQQQQQQHHQQQHHQHQHQQQQHMVQHQQAMMPQGPYFINPDPVQALPQPVPTDFPTRPPLYRSGYTNPLDFIPPTAPMMPDQHELHGYNYPSPGLSNGLDTLALAASDHRRMSHEDSS